MSKPVCIDLFCGLFGWGSAFASAGYRVVGFDIEDQGANFGIQKPNGCELVLRDIRSITGAELVKTYGVPAVIVASPPCQEFSYMAMPWSKAREKQRKIEADPAEQKRLCDLFNQCFRIQREVSAAAGHFVPLVVENVRGAQRWVGKARWNFGSFFLWGDVPALMPIPIKARMKSKISCAARRFDERIASTADEAAALHYRLPKNEGNKTAGMNWSDREKKGQDFTRIAGRQAEGVKAQSENGLRTDPGKGARFTSRDCGAEGTKQAGIGGVRDNGKGDVWFQNGAARSGSKSSARKRASAEIAKIPPALAQWIARCFKPEPKPSLNKYSERC